MQYLLVNLQLNPRWLKHLGLLQPGLSGWRLCSRSMLRHERTYWEEPHSRLPESPFQASLFQIPIKSRRAREARARLSVMRDRLVD
jgi:hypothetical protein